METLTTLAVDPHVEQMSDLEPAGPDLPDFFDGEEPSSCDWEDGWCSELATHYILAYCSYPDCKDDHTSRYCLRHYIINLGLKLDHLKVCPSMRIASTPDDIRRVIIEHVPGFGEIGAESRRRGNDAARDDADRDTVQDPAEERMADDDGIDDKLDKLEESRVHSGSYDSLHMDETTTLADVQRWLDGLELCHWRMRVMYFSWLDDEPMYLQESRYDNSWEDDPYRSRVYDPIANELEWSAADSLSIERRGLLAPKLVTDQDPDTGELRYWYTCDTLRAQEMIESGQLTDSETIRVPKTFALVEERTDTVMPFTDGSWLQWKAQFDGDENQMTICDAATFRRSIVPYLEYYDENRPLDVAEARTRAAQLEGRINRMIRDGVR
ncbi:hypothetical protein [Bifidobacterium sp. SO1]|uniref:hypothetical protein n=1 Tax=Bifidobacterium sp. SO1 TaxID=2809029 RepID=UPI001BDC42F4|nr:hypothetical protein [Bifidobacterium sp. SO1]MBT1161028.1 hypothetical protein [Bifidobacterium sp. SO1]